MPADGVLQTSREFATSIGILDITLTDEQGYPGEIEVVDARYTADFGVTRFIFSWHMTQSDASSGLNPLTEGVPDPIKASHARPEGYAATFSPTQDVLTKLTGSSVSSPPQPKHIEKIKRTDRIRVIDELSL